MMLVVLMLLAAPARVVLVDDLVRVPPGRSRALDVLLKQRGAVVECMFTVERGGSGVRVALMSRAESDRFDAGRSHRPLISLPYQRNGSFRHPVAEPGEYRLVIDNRLEGRGPALVRLQVTAVFDDPMLQLRELPADRRARIVAVSLGLFALSALAGAWLIVRAVRRPHTEDH